MKIVVIIPTYNEVATLGTLLPLILQEDERFEILVIGQANRFDAFQGIYHARLLNALVGALTIMLLFRFVERLGGLRAALLTSTLFLFDPFVVRINRRNMLETMGEFWVLLGLYLFWCERNRLKWPQTILIGTIFGLALLTKEMMIFGLAVLPLFILLSKRWQDIKKVGMICGIALAVWLLFPLWAWWIGYGQAFIENKSHNVRRLLGFIQHTGWNRSQVSFLNALQVHLEQYGTSYLLILLGGLLLLVMWRTWRDEKGYFIVAWGTVMYLLSIHIILFGTLHEYFFYYLIVPLMVLVGTMTIRLIDSLVGHPLQQQTLLVIVLFLVMIQSFNVYRWVKLFATEDDRALYELTEYISETVPPGTTVNSMFHQNSQLLPAMLPEYEVVGMRHPATIQEKKVEYIALSSKNLWGAYDLMTPDYYKWVETHGELVFSTYGNTFWDVTLYRLPVEQRK